MRKKRIEGKNILIISLLAVLLLSISIIYLYTSKNQDDTVLKESRLIIEKTSSAQPGESIAVGNRKFIKGIIEKTVVDGDKISLSIMNQDMAQDIVTNEKTYIFTATDGSKQIAIDMQDIIAGKYDLTGKSALIEYNEANGQLVALTISVI